MLLVFCHLNSIYNIYNLCHCYLSDLPWHKMSEDQLIAWMSYVMIAFGMMTFAAMIFTSITAPYGRYGPQASGMTPWWLKGVLSYTVDARLGWFLQELPSLAIPAYLWLTSSSNSDNIFVNKLLLAAFLLHYTQR